MIFALALLAALLLCLVLVLAECWLSPLAEEPENAIPPDPDPPPLYDRLPVARRTVPRRVGWCVRAAGGRVYRIEGWEVGGVVHTWVRISKATVLEESEA